MNWKLSDWIFDLWVIFLGIEMRSEVNFSFTYRTWMKVNVVLRKAKIGANFDKVNFLSIKALDLPFNLRSRWSFERSDGELFRR